MHNFWWNHWIFERISDGILEENSERIPWDVSEEFSRQILRKTSKVMSIRVSEGTHGNLPKRIIREIFRKNLEGKS